VDFRHRNPGAMVEGSPTKGSFATRRFMSRSAQAPGMRVAVPTPRRWRSHATGQRDRGGSRQGHERIHHSAGDGSR
jgi:hypothetical protein